MNSFATKKGPQIGTLAAGRKGTCQACNRTVRVEIDDQGEKHITDPELIAVVYEAHGDSTRRTVRRKVLAYRIHAELCETYKKTDERKAWAEEQRRKARAPTVREKRAHEKACNAAKRAGQPLPRAPWDQQPTPPTPNMVPTSRYANMDEARKAVLANYKAVERLRATLR